ncbi:pyridoxal phosphate-dependent aminotransferase [Ornithinimicrobium sp. F0845]|uniref:pyridoxal phosphate-dependent aminotransferase n=1 Tax=Ornithinimicrobium sp. F0845 TaxID=2926412 RepID=UPI001FF33F49|nr:pyridoxal phosphate-dependent aminotransferase [Ornithinimicrobium sp. F0845]MCK0111284.1 pyridoxal phosphate-dependent aminotransferase [Ornithinimicrobium sp. F0845]
MRNPLVTRMTGFGTTIFAEMTQAALRYDAVNLGQGFPDTDGPQELLDIAREAIDSGLNQYPPAIGLPVLRGAVAEHQRRFYGMDVDPDTEVLVTVGATEAIAAAILALVEPGEEVVTFEPFYDSYAASIALAGGVRRTVPLHFPDLAVDEAALRAAFGPRTRAVLLNTPHNPTGKVFTRAELELVAELAQEHDAVVVSDEVYEHLTFDGTAHIPIATLPGMAERTLTISSGGKTFSLTGWKVGWVHGPAELVGAVRAVKQFLTFVGSGPFQPAIAHGLGLPEEFFTGFAAEMQGKRDILVEALTGAGLPVMPCQGTYFVIADAAPLGVTDAVEFCRRMPEEVGVVGVPVSAFCDDVEPVASLVRFAFCKQEDVLREGARRLAGLRTR